MAVDLRGKRFDSQPPPRRVVSLVPSVTETLFELGAGDSVVGVTDFCIFPDSIPASVGRIGGTKNPDVGRIRDLRPDLVYVNAEENLRRHAEEIEEFAPLFVSEPKTVLDVIELISVIGQVHDRLAQADGWAARIRAAQTDLPGQAFRFACPIWKDPWMWCGGDTYVSNLVSSAGGKNVLDEENRYPRHDLRSVAELNPDIVFLPDEPYLFTSEDAAVLRTGLSARIVGPFPGHLFTWHGTRTLLGLEFLREAMSQEREGFAG